MGTLFAFDSPLWRSIDRILRFLWLSILWFICSIPIITIGASTTALYSVMLKYVKNNDGYLTASFLKAFRENFKQATAVLLIFGGIGILLFTGLIFYFQMQTTGVFRLIMMTIFLSICVSFLLINQLVYPLLAAFDNTVARTVFNASVMALTHLPQGILVFTLFIILMGIGTTLFPPLLMITPALMAYINARILDKLFDVYRGSTGSPCEEYV